MIKDYKEHWLDAPKKSSKHSAYFNVYNKIYRQVFQKDKLRILEIGVSTGGSLEATASYFSSHKDCRIVGLEFNPNVANFKWENKNITVEIGNAEYIKTFNDLHSKYGEFDLIIDDGGHTNKQQLRALEASKFLLKNDGILIIEDTQCSYLAEFGNPSGNSIIEVSKKMIDGINARSEIISLKPMELEVASIEFSVGMVIFRFDKSEGADKCTQIVNRAEQSGTEDYRFKSQRKSVLRTLIKSKLIGNFVIKIRRFHTLKFLLKKMYNFISKDRKQSLETKKIVKDLLK